jgi:hypothetical protein
MERTSIVPDFVRKPLCLHASRKRKALRCHTNLPFVSKARGLRLLEGASEFLSQRNRILALYCCFPSFLNYHHHQHHHHRRVILSLLQILSAHSLFLQVEDSTSRSFDTFILESPAIFTLPLLFHFYIWRTPFHFLERETAPAMGSFTPNDNPFAGMRNTIKHRVSYFYDSDVGDFAYETGHPMKVSLFPYQIAVSCLGAQRPGASRELARAFVSKAWLLGS